MFMSGFIYVCFLTFMLTCLYLGLKAVYIKIKNDGFVEFLKAFFIAFVCVAIVYLLSVRVGESLLGGLGPSSKIHRINI